MDAKTLIKIQEGDQQAFHLLVNLYKEKVFGLCLKIIQNRELAEETAQDVFIKIFLAIKSFKGDAKLSTWIYRITYNTAISATRKKNVNKTQIQDDALGSNNLTEQTINSKDRQHQLSLAIAQLLPNERGLITMHYLEELSTKEIANITGMTLSNIKVSIHRSRKKLKSILEKQLKNETAWIN